MKLLVLFRRGRARARTDKSEAATARPSKLPRAPGPPPPLLEPATFTGIDGADVDLDVVEELPADVRVEVEDGALAVDAAWRRANAPLAEDLEKKARLQPRPVDAL